MTESEFPLHLPRLTKSKLWNMAPIEENCTEPLRADMFVEPINI